MIVAEITRDHFNEKYNDSFTEPLVGKKFEYGAMCEWWGWGDVAHSKEFAILPKTAFKLYDDDDELYYSGWLLNDDQCIVQSFVLKWAEVDSGCTTIKIKDGNEWKQEIG